jgi:hypothetical protein
MEGAAGLPPDTGHGTRGEREHSRRRHSGEKLTIRGFRGITTPEVTLCSNDLGGVGLMRGQAGLAARLEACSVERRP